MKNYHSESSKSQPPLPSSISIDEIRSSARSGELGPEFQLSSPEGEEVPSALCVSGTATHRADGTTSPDEHSESLLYLFNNNSTEIPPSVDLKHPDSKHRLECVKALSGILSPYHQKASETLHLNVKRIIDDAPSPDYIGFATLTFKDNVTNPKEAYARFRSMNSHFLADCPEFLEWLCVKERQKRGAWHYHLVIQLRQNIREGFDWEKYGSALKFKNHSVPYLSPKNKEYRKAMQEALRTASPYLRQIWQLLREELPKYGFGRSELLPIRSNEDAMARYLGKYIGKHLGARERQDKGVRLVSYSRNWIKNSARFQWNTDNSRKWRKKVKMFVNECTGGVASERPDEAWLLMRQQFGTDWMYRYTVEIMNMEERIEEEQNKIPF